VRIVIMMVMRWVLVVGLVAGCGRIGFGSLDDNSGGDNNGDDLATVDSGTGASTEDDDETTTGRYITGGTMFMSAPATSISAMTGPLTDTNMVLVVAIHWGDTTSSVTTVQDAFGNGFSSIGSMKRYNAAQSQIMWFKKVTTGTTINVYFDQPAPRLDLKWAAYRDIDQTSPILGNIGSSGTSVTADSGNLALAQSALVVGASGSRAPNAVAGPGFTQRHSSSGGVLEDLEAAPGTVNATATLSSANEWIIQMVALRPR
jgi:hypothetical protein